MTSREIHPYRALHAVIFEKVEQASEDKTIAVVASESEKVREFLAILDEVSREDDVVTYSTCTPDFISRSKP